MLVRIGNLAINSDAIVLIETTEGGTVFITTAAMGEYGASARYPLSGRDADAFRHWQREHEYDALAALEAHEREQAALAAAPRYEYAAPRYEYAVATGWVKAEVP